MVNFIFGVKGRIVKCRANPVPDLTKASGAVLIDNPGDHHYVEYRL